jgi:hypothetical protein
MPLAWLVQSMTYHYYTPAHRTQGSLLKPVPLKRASIDEIRLDRLGLPSGY